MAAISKPLVVFIPDTRGVLVEKRYGKGNLKIGMNVYSYSRLPGLPNRAALGSASPQVVMHGPHINTGTCPGATPECLEICYAARPVAENGPVFEMWQRNTVTDEVPPIPEDATMLRLHVSGDFDSAEYILNWVRRLEDRPDVTCWVYTKSWRVSDLLPYLEDLRALPNVQMFASMDKSNTRLPPKGWRRAWIDGDPRAGRPLLMRAHGKDVVSKHNLITFDGTPTYICPEETKRRENCEQCGYCLRGERNDVTFLEH
jgi:hypothetical protein